MEEGSAGGREYCREGGLERGNTGEVEYWRGGREYRREGGREYRRETCIQYSTKLIHAAVPKHADVSCLVSACPVTCKRADPALLPLWVLIIGRDAILHGTLRRHLGGPAHDVHIRLVPGPPPLTAFLTFISRQR